VYNNTTVDGGAASGGPSRIGRVVDNTPVCVCMCVCGRDRAKNKRTERVLRRTDRGTPVAVRVPLSLRYIAVDIQVQWCFFEIRRSFSFRFIFQFRFVLPARACFRFFHFFRFVVFDVPPCCGQPRLANKTTLETTGQVEVS